MVANKSHATRQRRTTASSSAEVMGLRDAMERDVDSDVADNAAKDVELVNVAVFTNQVDTRPIHHHNRDAHDTTALDA